VEPQKVPENYVRATVTGRVEDRLRTITQQIMSRTLLEKIIQEFKLYQGAHQSSELEALLADIPILGSYLGLKPLESDTAVERMRKDITVTVKGESTFTIAYQAMDPMVAMNVTNKLAYLFIEENLKVREQQVEGTGEFLENELNNSRQLLDRYEKQISEFKQRYVWELPQQLEPNLQALNRFQTELKTTNEDLTFALERKRSLEDLSSNSDLLSSDQETLGNDVGDSSLIVRLEQLKSQLSKLRLEYKEDYPDILQLRKQIQEVEGAIANSSKASTKTSKRKAKTSPAEVSLPLNLAIQLDQVNLEISTLKARKTYLANQIELYQKRVENTPLREQKLQSIMRDYENIQSNYHSLLEKRLQAKISENLEKRQQGEVFRILDLANYPVVPYKPNRWKIILIGIILALGSGVGLALLREEVDQTIRTEEQLWELIKFPVLASIPHRPVPKQPRLVKRDPTSKGMDRSSAKMNLLI
jgi:polysaccharide chain length determinant protein (PEP-CTERM system associated)